MHILMLSHGYPPTISGVTLVVQKLARAMNERGHKVTVVTGSDRGEAYRAEDQGVKLYRVRSTTNPFWTEGPLPLLTYDELKEIVDDVKPNIINTHDGAILSWQLYRLEQERPNIPELLTCHYLPKFVTYYIRIGDILDKIVSNIAWEYTLRMINGFDHIIFPSKSQQVAFKSEGLEKPSTVISNGLNLSRYHPIKESDEDLDIKYSLPPGPRILFVGRIAKDKNIDTLIKAMPYIWSTSKGHLLVVGRGKDRERLEELTRKTEMEHCVHFLGFVPEEDLPSIYRASDIFAIASDVEVQSIPTLQAAATGMPIVGANSAALPELIHHGKNGFLADPHNPEAFSDSIQRILDNPNMATEFGNASLKIGQEHSDDHTFNAYERIFRQHSLQN
jgi:1,2-diacylglycerol 3-alpha-glucosyltransferase